MMNKVIQIIKNHKKEAIVFSLFVVFLSIFMIASSFAALAPTEKIIISSDKSNYDDKESGSWQVTKSAKWTDKGEVTITYDVDSVRFENDYDKDIILVMDTSFTYDNSRFLERKKSDIKDLISRTFATGDNKIALISFNEDFTILSDFTNDENLLTGQVDQLGLSSSIRNFYRGLIGVETLLDQYEFVENREAIVLFITSSYASDVSGNYAAEYQIIKSTYPNVTIQGIQYTNASFLYSDIESISDNQFLFSDDFNDNILYEAVFSEPYGKFQITDLIDSRYFDVDVSSISLNCGSFSLEDDEHSLIWNLDDYYSDSKAKLTMKLKLKDEYLGQGGIYPVNESVNIHSKLGKLNEDVITTESPVLSDNYRVIYDGNAPEGCSVEGVPASQYYSVFDVVNISDSEPTCEGYTFKGWKIVTNDVTRTGDDYFIMPESDVVIRATWSKYEIAKSMDGTVYQNPKLYDVIKENAVMDNVASEYVSSSNGIDFSKDSSDTNGKGVYIRAGTENDTYPILYYRGDVDNNHVSFAGFCWNIVRTTDTGGVKLIYDGKLDSNGTCNNSSGDIGTSGFNSNLKSLVSVGYMYDEENYIYTYDVSEPYPFHGDTFFGSDVKYVNGVYQLQDSLEYAFADLTAISTLPPEILERRYFCDGGESCDTVYYLVNMTSSNIFIYIKLENGETIDDALNMMTINSQNSKNSVVKTVVDNWYQSHMLDYTTYLEDTVWCNDRSAHNGYLNSDGIYFSGWWRKNNGSPSLQCSNLNDSFTVNSDNGNGALTYPAALLTMDEVMLAGYSSGVATNNYLYSNGFSWWTMTPTGMFSYYGNYVPIIYDFGTSSAYTYSDNQLNVRPAISLREGLSVGSGVGTSDDPYIIVLADY